jgi:hypothetical protein
MVTERKANTGNVINRVRDKRKESEKKVYLYGKGERDKKNIQHPPTNQN